MSLCLSIDCASAVLFLLLLRVHVLSSLLSLCIGKSFFPLPVSSLLLSRFFHVLCSLLLLRLLLPCFLLSRLSFFFSRSCSNFHISCLFLHNHLLVVFPRILLLLILSLRDPFLYPPHDIVLQLVLVMFALPWSPSCLSPHPPFSISFHQILSLYSPFSFISFFLCRPIIYFPLSCFWTYFPPQSLVPIPTFSPY